jgi:hypothetical protein
VDYGHQDHPIEWHVDLCLALGKHLVLLHNLNNIDIIHLDNLKCPFKRQGV